MQKNLSFLPLEELFAREKAPTRAAPNVSVSGPFPRVLNDGRRFSESRLMHLQVFVAFYKDRSPRKASKFPSSNLFIYFIYLYGTSLVFHVLYAIFKFLKSFPTP